MAATPSALPAVAVERLRLTARPRDSELAALAFTTAASDNVWEPTQGLMFSRSTHSSSSPSS